MKHKPTKTVIYIKIAAKKWKIWMQRKSDNRMHTYTAFGIRIFWFIQAFYFLNHFYSYKTPRSRAFKHTRSHKHSEQSIASIAIENIATRAKRDGCKESSIRYKYNNDSSNNSSKTVTKESICIESILVLREKLYMNERVEKKF